MHPPTISYCAEPNSPLPRSGLVHFTLCAGVHNWQNGTNESFNGKFRDECLSMEWFRNRVDAKIVIESWRRHYNEVRPHSSLGNLTPVQFKQQLSQPRLERAYS
jgi:transposase InsO family protein